MKNEMEKNELSTPGNSNASEQPTIFTDISTDMTGYDKNLKRARIYLYIVAALQLGVGIYEYVKYDYLGESYRFLLLGVDGGIGLIFIALTAWSYKKPVPSFIAALSVYIVAQVLAIIGDPTMIYKGIILKILIIVTLIRAIKDAREFEALKTSLGNQ